MPLVILHHLLNVSVQLANKRGLKKSLNGSRGPRNVSRRALDLVEDILSTYYKFTLSAINHKLNVSGHILFGVLVCGTRAQSLSATFTFECCILLRIYLTGSL
jgi:hypothetical protein